MRLKLKFINQNSQVTLLFTNNLPTVSPTMSPNNRSDTSLARESRTQNIQRAYKIFFSFPGEEIRHPLGLPIHRYVVDKILEIPAKFPPVQDVWRERAIHIIKLKKGNWLPCFPWDIVSLIQYSLKEYKSNFKLKSSLHHSQFNNEKIINLIFIARFIISIYSLNSSKLIYLVCSRKKKKKVKGRGCPCLRQSLSPWANDLVPPPPPPLLPPPLPFSILLEEAAALPDSSTSCLAVSPTMSAPIPSIYRVSSNFARLLPVGSVQGRMGADKEVSGRRRFIEREQSATDSSAGWLAPQLLSGRSQRGRCFHDIDLLH